VVLVLKGKILREEIVSFKVGCSCLRLCSEGENDLHGVEGGNADRIQIVGNGIWSVFEGGEKGKGGRMPRLKKTHECEEKTGGV